MLFIYIQITFGFLRHTLLHPQINATVIYSPSQEDILHNVQF